MFSYWSCWLHRQDQHKNKTKLCSLMHLFIFKAGLWIFFWTKAHYSGTFFRQTFVILPFSLTFLVSVIPQGATWAAFWKVRIVLGVLTVTYFLLLNVKKKLIIINFCCFNRLALHCQHLWTQHKARARIQLQQFRCGSATYRKVAFCPILRCTVLNANKVTCAVLDTINMFL